MADSKALLALRKEAAAILSEAMDSSAAVVLEAVEKYGVELQAFCKQVCAEAKMPEAWEALRGRARRLKARSDATPMRPPTRRASTAKYEMKALIQANPKAAREIALETLDQVATPAPRREGSSKPVSSLKNRLQARLASIALAIDSVADAMDETCSGSRWDHSVLQVENAVRTLSPGRSGELRMVK